MPAAAEVCLGGAEKLSFAAPGAAAWTWASGLSPCCARAPLSFCSGASVSGRPLGSHDFLSWGLSELFPNEMAVSGLPSQAHCVHAFCFLLLHLPSCPLPAPNLREAPSWVGRWCWAGGEPRVLEEVTVCHFAVRPALGIVAPPSPPCSPSQPTRAASLRRARCWSVHHGR